MIALSHRLMSLIRFTLDPWDGLRGVPESTLFLDSVRGKGSENCPGYREVIGAGYYMQVAITDNMAVLRGEQQKLFSGTEVFLRVRSHGKVLSDSPDLTYLSVTYFYSALTWSRTSN